MLDGPSPLALVLFALVLFALVPFALVLSR
jgi:hypothetical protein